MKEENTAAEVREVHTCHLSYYSHMTDVVTFEDQAQVEIHGRGVSQAKAVYVVANGADWIQEFVDLHRPDAVHMRK